MNKKQIEDLNQIRVLMEKSSKFLSLSGLSGIVAGSVAIAGALFAFFYLQFDMRYFNTDMYFIKKQYGLLYQGLNYLILDAAIVFLVAFGAGILFTIRKAKKHQFNYWDNTAKRMLTNLLIPLVAGGVFCFILIYHQIIYLVAPATLIFYGLALLNASKYTLGEIRLLGISEIILGLISATFIGYGLLFWTIGFGLLHIIYGTVMYYRYEYKFVTKG